MPMRNQGYKLLQLSQPSRPIQGYNMYLESSTPRDRLLHQYRNPEPIQFAQPTSPINSMSPKPCMPENRYQYQFYDSGLMQIPQSPRPIGTYNMSYTYNMPQERYPYQYRKPEPIQFAQPTSPINSMSPKPCMSENRYQHQFYDSGLMQIPQSPRPIGTYNMSYTYNMPQEQYPYQNIGPGHVPTITPITAGEGSEVVDDITKGNSELYNRLPANLSQSVILSNQNMPMRNEGYNLLQFPQPSRPLQGYNMYFETCSPRDKLFHQYCNPQPIQFAQPTGPINSMSPKPCLPENRYQNQFYDSGIMQIPQSPRPIGTYNMSYTYHLPQERYPYQYLDQGHIPTTMPMTTEEGREAFDDKTKGNLELYSRLPAILSQLNLDRINNKLTTAMDRGLNQHSTRGLRGHVEQLSHKLERFKIRTIDLGGVVNVEEEQRNQMHVKVNSSLSPPIDNISLSSNIVPCLCQDFHVMNSV